MPSRRLEDKIRHVCSLAMVTDSDEAWLILSELRTLLREHIQHLRTVAAGKLSGASEFFERRSNDSPPGHLPSNTPSSIPADSASLTEVSLHGRTDQRASATDFDSSGHIGGESTDLRRVG